jgi:hypothetical protein
MRKSNARNALPSAKSRKNGVKAGVFFEEIPRDCEKLFEQVCGM